LADARASSRKRMPNVATITPPNDDPQVAQDLRVIELREPASHGIEARPSKGSSLHAPPLSRRRGHSSKRVSDAPPRKVWTCLLPSYPPLLSYQSSRTIQPTRHCCCHPMSPFQATSGASPKASGAKVTAGPGRTSHSPRSASAL
jgi:hypothetical protein